jgi:soluble lytic murein transglycosylase-like protein
VIAAYNGGISAVDRWLDGSKEDLDPTRIGYPETRAYVERVMKTWRALRAGHRANGS